MLFHSQEFLLIFLPVVLAGYYLLAAHRRLRQWLVIAASLVFYGYWDVRLVPLLVASVTVNWLFAFAFAGGARRWLVPVGVGLNLLVLGVFKYADFFGATLAALGGVTHDPWNIVLPLGISFFTFQQISYLVDLRRGTAPGYGFRDYAMFVCFFPQLIAGPIVRHNELIHQFGLSPWREGVYERLSRGLALLVIGVFKKAVIADNMAASADPLFAAAAAGQALGFAKAWTATTAFGLQIYFDFSAYSDMAVGLGLMFGFALPLNFNAPYRATSIREFWRRWHMTLSRFLRDYLYIPLGGNRHGLPREVAALLVTMLLGGLWHGAAWTFVAWGGVHGLAVAANHLWRRAGGRMPAAPAWLLTLAVTFFAWTLFRSESFAAAGDMVAAMVGGNGWDLALDGVHKPWIIPLAAGLSLLGPTSQRLAFDLLEPRPLVAYGLACALVFAVLQVGTGISQEFIYFQF